MDVLWFVSETGRPWQRREPSAGAGSAPGLTVTASADQTMLGFGGCFNELGWTALGRLSAEERTAVLADLFGEDGCRFSFCRMPIGASDFALEWYSLAEHPEDYAMERFSIGRDRGCLIPYIREAMRFRPDLRLFASPWSPPVWMKVRRVYNGSSLRPEPAVREAYALYLARTVEAFRAEGVPLVQVHPQNEPIADQKFPSCLWTGAEMRDFIRDHLGPLFERRRVPAEIWLGTLNCEDYVEWFLTPLADEGCRRFVKGLGVQWWAKRVVQRVRRAFPDLPMVQTENECGDGSNAWDHAHHVFGLMWQYLVNGACGYVYWNMVLPEGGESTWGMPQNSMVTVTEGGRAVRNPEYWLMRHLAAHVPPGSVRLETEGLWAGNALAFRRPDGRVVLVLENPLSEPRRLAVEGESPVFGLTLELPPRSFHTVVVG